MAFVTVNDCEFPTAPGAPSRFWCGPSDPDPLCVQIGPVKLSLDTPFEVSASEGGLLLNRGTDDARADAASVAIALQHLLAEKRLNPDEIRALA